MPNGKTDTLRTNLPTIARLGARVFVANVLPVTAAGEPVRDTDIQPQTHAAFQRLRDALTAAGVELADLVRINTYYVYDGPDDTVTRYWERMTEVRLQYFPDPGPVGTAVRVAGCRLPGALLQLEAEALAPAQRDSRQRLMPEDRWDWSVPLPLSQGWRLDDYVWVGGQISADRRGRAVHVGDLQAQTQAVLRHIGSVMRTAGASPSELLHLKICYLHDGDAAASEERLARILEVVQREYGDAVPPVTAFGVNLLYEGLLLEIDAAGAIAEPAQTARRTAGAVNLNRAASCQGLRRGRYLQVAGQSAPLTDSNAATSESASLADQARACLRMGLGQIEALGGRPENVGRLTALVSKAAAQRAGAPDLSDVLAQLRAPWAGAAAPAVTVVRVEGLPADAPVQVDVFGVLDERLASLNTEGDGR